MIGARVVFIANPTFGLGRPRMDTRGIHVARRARIGSGAVLSPPLDIGQEAVIGAGSFVRADVAARTVVVGLPARYVRMDELAEDRTSAVNEASESAE